MNWKRQMKNVYIKLILMVCIAISACTNDIPKQTRELLHGVWARTGYKEKIPVLYTPENIAASFEDTVDTLNDTTFCLVLSNEPLINKDSLTFAERNSTTSIWVIEECYVNNKYVRHPVCLTYQGKGLFYSDKNAIDGTMKYLRIKDKKDSTVEYGKCDSDGKILSNVELSQLFTGKSWYFDRGLFGWSDYSYRSDDQLESLFFNEAFKNVKCIELRQSLRDGDSLICVYDMKDVIKKNGIWINNSNSTVFVDTLRPHLKYAEEVDLRDPEAARSNYSLNWRGDSAFLQNRNLQGTFYLKVIR